MTRVLACLLLLPLLVRAQEGAPAPASVPPAPAAPAAEAAAPAIYCEQPTYDFGSAESTKTVSHEYVIQNKGNATLEIAQVRPSCGCTVANISERSVPAGGSTRVTAQLNLAGRSGPQHKTVTVDSNDPKQPQLTLMLQGTVGEVVSVQPPSVMLGQLRSNATASAVVSISCAQQPMRILSVDAGTPLLQVAVVTNSPQAYQLTISTAGPLPEGALAGVVRVATDHPSRPVIDIAVQGLVIGDLIVSPAALSLEEQPSQSVVSTIILRSSNNQAFQISGVTPPEAGITANVLPFGPNGFRVQLANIHPTRELEGKEVVIKTTMPNHEEVRIPFRIRLVGPQS